MSSLDPPDSAISPMDTSPISQAVDPAFLSSVPPPDPGLLHAPPLYIDKSNPVMDPLHDPLADLAFSPMETLEATAPSVHPTASPYARDYVPFRLVQPMENSMGLEVSPVDPILSTSPPRPSPPEHAPSSSYSVGVTSSLESALDPTGVSSGQSRSSSSVSPPVNPLYPPGPIGSQQPLSMAFPNSEITLAELIDPQPSSEPHRFLLPLLKQCVTSFYPFSSSQRPLFLFLESR